MPNEWINPKIIIGNTATGDSYYNRPEIVSNIWAEIKKGNHVLLAAPRRVGKSSVMKYMTENCEEGYKCIFENIQGIDEASDYVSWATDNKATIQYSPELRSYLLSKIKYHLPYFINLMLDEINKTARKEKSAVISPAQIDHAFDRVVKTSDHFKEWKSRLFDYMTETEAAFLNEVLIYIAHNEALSQQKLYEIANRHNKINDYMDLIDGLDRDGYIVENDENYIFISPFLKSFWKRNNPVYHAA